MLSLRPTVLLLAITLLSACDRPVATINKKESAPLALPPGSLLALRVGEGESDAAWTVRYRLRWNLKATTLHIDAQLRERGKVVYNDGEKRLLLTEKQLGVPYSLTGLNLYAKRLRNAQGRLDTLLGMSTEATKSARRCTVFSSSSLNSEELATGAADGVKRKLKELGVSSKASTEIAKGAESKAKGKLGNSGVGVSSKGSIPGTEISPGALVTRVWPERVEIKETKQGQSVLLGAILYDEKPEDQKRSLNERVARAPKALLLLVRLSK